jgi:hypothetical protein
VESYYSEIASDINTDDNTYSPEGMKVDGTFMSWEEARKHYLTEGNGDALKTLYKNIVNIARSDMDDVAGPDLQKANLDLYNTIIGLNTDIDEVSTRLLTGWEEQTRVYNGVMEMMVNNKEITMLEYNMLDAYPLFNSRGRMQEPEKIMQKMQQDFANYINNPGGSQLTPEDAAENFGFYDVADMNETIDGSKNGSKVATKHFKNVFDEYWGKHSVEELFKEIKNKVNHNMSKADALPGVQNFNLASYMTNQSQAGGGGIIYDFHTAKYVNGQANAKANVQMRLINQLLSGPKSNYIIQLGDKSKMVDGVPGYKIGDEDGQTHPHAEQSVRELISDTGLDPSKFPLGKAPDFTIKWAERIGGDGTKSGWVITYGEEYASTHKSSNAKTNNNIALLMPGNSVTVFAPPEYAQMNPLAVDNSYTSVTEYQVNQNKSRVISNDGGYIKFFRNGNGQMVYITATASFDGDTESSTYGDIVYSTYSKPEIIGPSGYEIDKIYNAFMAKSQGYAKDNHDAMEAHKKTLKK